MSNAEQAQKETFLDLDMCWLQKHNSGPILVETHTLRCSHGTPAVSASFIRRVRLCHGCGSWRKLQKTTSPGTLHGRCTRSKAVGTSNHNIPQHWAQLSKLDAQQTNNQQAYTSVNSTGHMKAVDTINGIQTVE